MSCYPQPKLCTCGNQQAEKPNTGAELRRAKRDIARMLKAVQAAVQQAEEDVASANEAADDAERVNIVVSARETLSTTLGFLAEEN